jgi:MtN3 and saliva related transmembrane protein
MDFTTFVGLVAASCTTASYYPQLKKCWKTRSAGDLSLKMFLTLGAGVALWVVYGFFAVRPNHHPGECDQSGPAHGILCFKLRDRNAPA